MKKNFLVLTVMLCFVSGIFAFEADDAYEYNQVVSQIQEVKAPYVDGDYIVFTAPHNSRGVSIAFDHEDFKTVHSFVLHKSIDFDGNETNSWFYYLLKKPKDISTIRYRLIIDGLWTPDPLNENTVYDSTVRARLSVFSFPANKKVATENLTSGMTKFVCLADSGKEIRLGGTFTGWDSWIYTMNEVSPGRYELSLPLPAGTYYYSYYSGISAFLDPTNPKKGYTSDGRAVSCIVVK